MPDKRTYADRREYYIAAVAKRRKKLKLFAIEYKGGKCQLCGYSRCVSALELHHFRGDKSFGIAQKGYTRSWEKIREELEKCVLLCANCHREVEYGYVEMNLWKTAV
jgi:5-methylcytosine-specific restriction endonuclease McrA